MNWEEGGELMAGSYGGFTVKPPEYTFSNSRNQFSKIFFQSTTHRLK